MRLLLALDLGIAGCGACLYDMDADSIYRIGGTITYKEKRLKTTIDDFRRMGLVLDFLQPFRDAGPLGVAFEAPAGAKSATAEKSLATGRTMVFMLAREDGLEWRGYTVGACKKAVGLKGNGKKDKKATQKVVMARWPMAEWPIGEKHFEDAADAAAVVLAAEQDGFVEHLKERWKHLQ